MALHGFDYVLQWSDFKQVDTPPPGEDGEDNTGQAAAVRAYASLDNVRTGIDPLRKEWHVSEADVSIQVDRERSWVLRKVVLAGDSAELRALLAHEQQHYNITAIGARDLYGKLLKMKAKYDTEDAGKIATAIVMEARRNTSTVNARYDGAMKCGTNHGLQVQNQATWEHRIAKALGARGTLSELDSCPSSPDGRTVVGKGS